MVGVIVKLYAYMTDFVHKIMKHLKKKNFVDNKGPLGTK